MCLTKQSNAYETKAFFINLVQTQVTAISSIALRNPQSFSPSPSEASGGLHWLCISVLSSSPAQFLHSPLDKKHRDTFQEIHRKKTTRTAFPLQTVQAAFEVLCLQRLDQVQTATENEELRESSSISMWRTQPPNSRVYIAFASIQAKTMKL